MIDRASLVAALLKLRQSENIVVFSHVRPDGDAVGSLLAVGLALEDRGKRVQMVLADGVPSNFRFLPGADKINTHYAEPVDLIIIVDSSDVDRIGIRLPESRIPVINIDHHVTNTRFGTINLVDPEATATAEILACYLPDLGLECSQEMAEALLTGIITDTIGFRTNNMRPLTLRLAADLMERGAQLSQLYKRTLTQRTLNELRYWGAGLSALKLEGGIVWTELKLADRLVANYPGRDDADLINLLSAVPEADISLVFIEQEGGTVKISWRAQDGFDVSQVAAMFGGGGHRAAAGAEVKGELTEVEEKVLQKTKLLVTNARIHQ